MTGEQWKQIEAKYYMQVVRRMPMVLERAVSRCTSSPSIRTIVSKCSCCVTSNMLLTEAFVFVRGADRLGCNHHRAVLVPAGMPYLTGFSEA